MLPETVNMMLSRYREYAGRCSHLENEIAVLQAEITREKANILYDVSALGAQNLDGMPHGTNVGQPTEKAAMMLVEGRTPSIAELENRLSECKKEYAAKHQTIVFVDGWLNGLQEKERWIIEKQVIEALTWREIAMRFSHEFGVMRSKEGLKKIKLRALQKIYMLAR